MSKTNEQRYTERNYRSGKVITPTFVESDTVTPEGAYRGEIEGTDPDTNERVQAAVVEGQYKHSLAVSADQQDFLTNSIRNVTNTHNRIHAGKLFTNRNYQTVASNGDYDILIVTPEDSPVMHAVFEADAQDGEMIVSLYEDVVTTDDGTPTTSFNRNRNSGNTTSALIYEGPTISDIGDLLFSAAFGSSKQFGGGNRDSNEINLKKNTKYVLRLHNNTTSDNKINRTIDWYEVD